MKHVKKNAWNTSLSDLGVRVFGKEMFRLEKLIYLSKHGCLLVAVILLLAAMATYINFQQYNIEGLSPDGCFHDEIYFHSS